MKKYTISKTKANTCEMDGVIYHRVKLTKQFNDSDAPLVLGGYADENGLGGWVSEPENLNQQGCCWVNPGAFLGPGVRLFNNSLVSGESKLKGSIRLFDNAKISSAHIDLSDTKGRLLMYNDTHFRQLVAFSLRKEKVTYSWHGDLFLRDSTTINTPAVVNIPLDKALHVTGYSILSQCYIDLPPTRPMITNVYDNDITNITIHDHTACSTDTYREGAELFPVIKDKRSFMSIVNVGSRGDDLYITASNAPGEYIITTGCFSGTFDMFKRSLYDNFKYKQTMKKLNDKGRNYLALVNTTIQHMKLRET